MEAGYGAEEQATRRSRKVERLRREAAADDAARSEVEAALARAQRDQRNWAAGAEGERQVAAALEPLAQFGWTALHDVRWPGRPQANIDHIAIGPGGVVVLDAKNWTGDITLADGRLRQNGYGRERELEGVAQATAAVTALVAPQHRSAVSGLLVLAGQEQPPTTTASGVPVVGRLQLAAHLAGRPARLTPYEVAGIGGLLQAQLTGPRSPYQATTAALDRPARKPRREPRPAAVRPPRSRPPRPATRRRQRDSCGAALLKLVPTLIAIGFVYNIAMGALQSMTDRVSTPGPTVPAVSPAVETPPPAAPAGEGAAASD